MARVYTIDPTLTMERAAIHCETCGRGYRTDTISDADGPRSIWRGPCDCTRSGRTDLRAGRRAPDVAHDGHRPGHTDADNGNGDSDLNPPRE